MHVACSKDPKGRASAARVRAVGGCAWKEAKGGRPVARRQQRTWVTSVKGKRKGADSSKYSSHSAVVACVREHDVDDASRVCWWGRYKETYPTADR